MTPGVGVAVVALLVSVAAVLYSRRQTQTSERSDAREEAIELADIRGKVINDLEERLDNVEREQEREREEHSKKIRLLEQVIEHVRTEAAEAQRMLVVGFRGVAVKVLGHLEADPPEVDKAVEYLRDMLATDGPDAPPSLRRRRAA